MSTDPMPIPGLDMHSLASVYADHGYLVFAVVDIGNHVVGTTSVETPGELKATIRTSWDRYNRAKEAGAQQPQCAVLFTPDTWEWLHKPEVPSHIHARAEQLRMDGRRYGVPVEVAL